MTTDTLNTPEEIVPLTPEQQAEADQTEHAAFMAEVEKDDPEVKTRNAETQRLRQETDVEPGDGTTETPAPAGDAAAAPAAADETKAAPEPTAADTQRAALEQEIQRLEQTHHRMESKLGRLERQLQDSLNKPGSRAAPTGANAGPQTKEQIRKSLEALPEFKSMQTEFPEYAKVIEHVLNTAVMQASPHAPVDAEGLRQSLRAEIQAEMKAEFEDLRLAQKHGDWKKTINSPEFEDFTYQNGPSKEERQQLKTLEQAALEARKSRDERTARQYDQRWNETLNNQIRKYPNWWSETGAALFSNDVNDSLSLLDKYTEHKTSKTQPPTSRNPPSNKRQRLVQDIDPTGGKTAPVKHRPLTEAEAMVQEFYR